MNPAILFTRFRAAYHYHKATPECSNMSVREVMERHGLSKPTVGLIRQAMMAAGWVPPVRPPKVRVYVPRPHRPPLTPAELVGRHAAVVFWLRSGNRSIAWIAARTGKSGNTVRLVKRLLIAMCEDVPKGHDAEWNDPNAPLMSAPTDVG